MIHPVYRFTFPFRGQVKTQLKITRTNNGQARLVKPANVKRFEDAVRTILSVHFPIEQRPIEGYLRFDMIHYSLYRRDESGAIIPRSSGDLDNLYKTLADCFEPVYIKQTIFRDDGSPELTEKGNLRYKKVEATPGVIKNDKYISRASLCWVPVETEEEERIEVLLSTLEEPELFKPPAFASRPVVDLDL